MLWWLAQIAHETDMGDGRHDTQEAHGMDVVVRGLSIVCDDERMQKLTGTSCDGIHTYYHRAPLLGPERCEHGDHGAPTRCQRAADTTIRFVREDTRV